MNKFRFPERAPLVTLVSIGLGLGLLLTGFSWLSPNFAKNLFSGATWFWVLFLVGTLLVLLGAKLGQEQHYPTVSKPALLLAVAAATALVYLFPELFAPGCKGMPRAFAACPAACRITTCSDWAAPGERGCDAKPPDKGCCFAYDTTCDPACSEPDPDPTPVPNQPPSVSGSVSCALNGSSGWCRSGAVLNLSASDPQGFATTITGDIAGVPFSCAGPNCAKNLPAGSGAIHFQASAPSSGLSSAAGSTSFAYDPTPPTAALAISGIPGSAGWYTTASVSTTGSDATSGISTTQVSVDGGSWQASASLAEGTHSILGRAIDNAGNTSNTPAQTVKVDATLPTISASVTSGTLVAGWYVTDVTLTAVASDAISGLALIEHRLDTGAWSAGNTLTVTSEGSHTIDFRATDVAGLKSTTSLIVKLDKTAPIVTFTPSGTLGTNGWYTTPVTLQVNASDPLSGVASIEHRLDAGNWISGSSLTISDGEHTVEARATDKAGNLSAVTTATTTGIKVDTIAPTLSLSLTGTLGQNSWYVSDVSLTASVSDATSGIALTEYRLDSGSWLSGTSMTTSADGPHTVDFRTTDRAGNQTLASRSFKIDQTAPVLSFTPTGTMGENGWYISDVSLKINSSDGESGIQSVVYRVNQGSWISAANLSLGEGIQDVDARVTDQAGNISTASIRLQIDTTVPGLILSLSGTSGKNNWYISNVTSTASVSDTTSGKALTEYRVDAGSWQTGTNVIVSSDGTHTVDFRATDHAGNQSSASRAFKIDQTPPVSAFVAPLEGSTGTLAQGLFSLDGGSTDATSGLAAVQISTDEGLTWLELTLSPAGNWQFVWDTKPLSNGLYPVLARAEDQAGNIESTARVTLLLANHPPKVSIQDSWWIWEAGSLSVKQRFIPISEIRVRITCLDGQPDVKLTFTPETIPAVLSWDRKCGQGQFATAGDHPVTLAACDKFGNCAEATGLIKVPFIAPPVPTWTPTFEPTTTSTPAATRVVQKPQPTATLVVITPVVTPAPTPAPESEKLHTWFWAALSLIGFLAALTAASLADPRPRALRRLGKTMDKVRNGQA